MGWPRYKERFLQFGPFFQFHDELLSVRRMVSMKKSVSYYKILQLADRQESSLRIVQDGLVGLESVNARNILG